MNSGKNSSANEIIDLTYLFRILLIWSWIPMLTALAGIYNGYQDLKGFTPQYTASMTVLPTGATGANTNSGGAVQSIAAELGLLPGTQATSVSPFNRLEFFLGSVALAERLQEKYGVMQILFAGSWDSENQQWTRPNGEDFERQEQIKAFLRQNLWSPPNLQSAANYIISSINIAAFDQGPFRKLTVTHEDPEFALWLLTTAYFEADELIRERDKLELEERMSYVELQLSSVDKIHIRDGLRQQLATELGREVALEVDLPYAAIIVEEPYIMNGLTEPNLPLIFGIPAVVGGIIGFLFISFIALFRREKRS